MIDKQELALKHSQHISSEHISGMIDKYKKSTKSFFNMKKMSKHCNNLMTAIENKHIPLSDEHVDHILSQRMSLVHRVLANSNRNLSDSHLHKLATHYDDHVRRDLASNHENLPEHISATLCSDRSDAVRLQMLYRKNLSKANQDAIANHPRNDPSSKMVKSILKQHQDSGYYK